VEERAANRWLTEAAGRASTYDQRWEQLAAQGTSIHGEADFVSSLGPSSVLDAGCGTGRVAIELAARGIDVCGVDIDASMLERARSKAPGLQWVVGDLATMELGRRFDVAVLAGNVMIYLQPGQEAAVVANVSGHLEPGGALVAGFSLDPRRLPLDAYDACCREAGLTLAERWATWEHGPFRGGDYAVSVHRLVQK
jgi:SAM-dependent methyltransferase